MNRDKELERLKAENAALQHETRIWFDRYAILFECAAIGELDWSATDGQMGIFKAWRREVDAIYRADFEAASRSKT